MAIAKIVTVQNPTLRKKSKPIHHFDKRLQNLFKQLAQTLSAQKDPVGVGLAAPQIGKNLRMFVIKHGKEIVPFINAEIIWKSEQTNDPKPPAGQPKSQIPNPESEVREYVMEGCLSLPHYYGPVQRAKSIKAKYQRPQMDNGQWSMVKEEKKYTGLIAQIIQHEVDHLNGVLFIDHLLAQNRKLFKLSKGEWQEVELP